MFRVLYTKYITMMYIYYQYNITGNELYNRKLLVYWFGVKLE